MHVAVIFLIILCNHFAKLLVECANESRERNDDRRRIARANDVEQFLVFLQIELHTARTVIGTVVDQNVIGTLVGNGRAIKVIGIRQGRRRNVSRACACHANRSVAHKNGAQIERFGSLPRVCCAYVILIATHHVKHRGGKNLATVVEIGIDQYTFSDGIANKLDGFTVVGRNGNGALGLHAHKGHLAR